MPIWGLIAYGAFRLEGVSLSFASPKESKQRRGSSLPKAKGDPWVGAPFGCSLRYSKRRAACLNSPAAQTRQAESPRHFCVARHLSRGPEKRQDSTSRAWRLAFSATDERIHFGGQWLSPRRLSGPHLKRRATQLPAEKGRGLSEGAARVPQPPPAASSAGESAQADRVSWGRLFFGYFLLAKQKKVRPPSRRKAAVVKTAEPQKTRHAAQIQATSLYRP